MNFNRMISGMIRAIKLDKAFYNEVEQDASYSRDALGVVVLVSLVGAVGSLLSVLFSGEILMAILSFIMMAAIALVGFFIWVYIAHWVGTKFFKGQGDRGELQRAMGFAYSPQILNILVVIPCLGALIALVAWVLTMVAGFIAVRESLDQDNTNAVLTVAVSAVVVFVITAILGVILSGLGLGAAAITGSLGG